MEHDQDRPETGTKQVANSHNESRGPLSQLTPEIYERLRQLGRRFMQRERSGHIMQATEVVNEALARLQYRHSDGYKDAQHFYATVAMQMRWVLVDYARRRRMKPVEVHATTDIEESASSSDNSDEFMLALHDALLKLEKQDEELARVCELYYFGGHTLPETAELMGVSVTTVTRKLRLAKAWLTVQINPGAML